MNRLTLGVAALAVTLAAGCSSDSASNDEPTGSAAPSASSSPTDGASPSPTGDASAAPSDDAGEDGSADPSATATPPVRITTCGQIGDGVGFIAIVSNNADEVRDVGLEVAILGADGTQLDLAYALAEKVPAGEAATVEGAGTGEVPSVPDDVTCKVLDVRSTPPE